jgi:hypothetical protein
MSCLAPILNMNGQKESPGAQNTPLTWERGLNMKNRKFNRRENYKE